jgi:predicted metal-binding membrane protein
MTAGLADIGHSMVMTPAPAAFARMWVVMMAAMMLPGLVPALLAEPAGQPGAASRVASGVALAGGYLAVWAAAGIIPFAAVSALSRAGQASPWLDRAGGAALVLAGAYQFSRTKRRLLAASDPQWPASARQAGGPAGWARSGLAHGLRCLGCSGALMAVLLVTGIMNLGWMAAISASCTAEKAGPWRVTVSRLTGAVLCGLGLAVVAWPQALRLIT